MSRVLEETGQFRPEQDRCGTYLSFKPTFGELKQVKQVQGAEVVDEKGRTQLTQLVKPVVEATEDADPVLVEIRMSIGLSITFSRQELNLIF